MGTFATPEEMERIHKILARHREFEADPDAWHDLLRHVAAGESPGHACDRLGLNLFELNAWIRSDPNKDHLTSRMGMMDEALVSRTEALRWKMEDQLQAIATCDVRVLFGENHQLLPASDWPPEVGMAVAGVDLQDLFEMVEAASGHGKEKVLIGYLKKIKVWDKLGAIDKLGKFHGLGQDKDVKKIAESLESLLARSLTPK